MFGEVELECVAGEEASREEANTAAGLEEAEVAVEEEEVETREHNAGVGDADMEDEEDDEENVEMVSVEEELKELPSDARECCCPYYESTH